MAIISLSGLHSFGDPHLIKESKTQNISVIETIDLVALSDSNQYNGSFFLGSGNINNSTYYYYYSETEHGLKLNKLDTQFNDVYIKYCSENERPRIEVEEETIVEECILENKPDFWSWEIHDYMEFKKYEIGTVVKEKEHKKTRYVIYVPEGSIKNDFYIDMQ